VPIYLFAHRYWTDDDSERFLRDPTALGLDPGSFAGQQIVIANGCQTGALLADVVERLQRFGAAKIILRSLKPRTGPR
jgi:hypothetical protein